MKKVICGKILQEKMKESIDLLCDTVKTTLGPKGNNAIIDHSDFSPFITNDGATIAKNIESDDAIMNTILEIAKEASLKTNDTVGDGTTTTLVLLQSIFNLSLKYIENGVNPILLKKDLNKSLEKIINELQTQIITPNKLLLKKIASIAANDEEIGSLVSKVYQKVQKKYAITIDEIEEDKMNVTYQKGYIFPITLASPYFLNGNSSINIHDAQVLIINDILYDIESISVILNDVINNKKNIIIIANNFDENFTQNILSLYLNKDLNCYLLKIEEYGIKHMYIKKDLEQIANAQTIESLEKINPLCLGFIKQISLTSEQAKINFKTNKKIENYLLEIKIAEKNTTDTFDKTFYQKRIAMFSQGLATIQIGAPTKTERREKRMRLEDSLCALESTKEGILPGSGITLLNLSNNLSNQNIADKIFKEALTNPFKQILNNAGLDIKTIENKIKEENYQVIYNVETNFFENTLDTNIIDSFSVIKNSLINATSIATMLLTTTSLIINEHETNIEKVNNFGEL